MDIQTSNLPATHVGPSVLDPWRVQVLKAILRTLFALSTIALLGAIFANRTNPEAVQLISLYLIAYVCIGVITFVKQVSYTIRASTLLVVLYGLAVLGLKASGLSGDGRIFLAAAVIMASLLFGRRVGLAILGLAIATFVLFGWQFAQGRWSIPVTMQANTADPIAWTTGGLIFVMLVMMISGSTAYLLNMLSDTLLLVWKYRGQLQEQIDTLEQSVLERTEALRQARDEAEVARYAAEAASLAKSTFLTNMSHELRSPLNAIINFTKFLDKPRYGPLTPRQKDLQQRVIINSDYLLGLINDLLDLAKIEAGRLDLVTAPTDPGPILRSVMETAVGLIKDKPIELESHIPDVLPLVLIDTTRIRQVLLNLLSNAAKFTHQGSITLRARALADRLEIAVIDTGIGIAPEHQALVFEEFRQVDDDFTRQYQGSGLGLPICKRLIELHGGHLSLTSEVGVGSTFTFTLSLAATQMAEAADTPSAGQA